MLMSFWFSRMTHIQDIMEVVKSLTQCLSHIFIIKSYLNIYLHLNGDIVLVIYWPSDVAYVSEIDFEVVLSTYKRCSTIVMEIFNQLLIHSLFNPQMEKVTSIEMVSSTEDTKEFVRKTTKRMFDSMDGTNQEKCLRIN